MNAPRSSVAVTGASGLLGRSLLDCLRQRGAQVTALSRVDRESAEGVRWLRGDLSDAKIVTTLVPPGGVVFHLGATLHGTASEITASIVTGTEHVVAAARARGARLVHVSSLSVLSPEGGSGRRHVDESVPLDPSPHHRGAYAAAKIAAERLVMEAVTDGLEAVIVRPAQVVGEMITAVPPSLGLQALGLRWSIAPLRGPMAVVHVDDAAEGLCLAAFGELSGTVVHLVDPLEPSRADLLRRLRDAGVKDATLTVIDIHQLANAGGWLMRRLGIKNAASHRLAALCSTPIYDIGVAAGMGWEPAALKGWLTPGTRSGS